MDAVNITVSHVDSDGSQGEAVLLSGAMDGDGRMQHIDHGRVVSAGRGVT